MHSRVIFSPGHFGLPKGCVPLCVCVYADTAPTKTGVKLPLPALRRSRSSLGEARFNFLANFQVPFVTTQTYSAESSPSFSPLSLHLQTITEGKI